MKRLLALFFLIIFFASCSTDRVPDGIIKQDSMINVLTDIHLADGYASANYADSSRQKVAEMYQAIYKRYHTDSLHVKESVLYYARHPDKMQLMYEKVTANLDLLSKAAQRLDERLYRERQKRISDSLFYNDKKRDSVNRGFKIDTFSYEPFRKFVPVKITAIINPGAGRTPAAKDSVAGKSAVVRNPKLRHQRERDK